MVHFLQGNLSLVAGLIALAVALLARRLMGDAALKTDLRGVAVLLVLFFAIRLPGALGLDGALPSAFRKLLNVAWMLAFTVGFLRVVVGFAAYFWRRLTGKQGSKILRDVLDVALAFFAILPIVKTQLDVDLTSLVATSAVLSLVLGLALQDTLGNLFSGLSLQLDSPYAVGDWVTVGHHTGRVLQVTWRSTRLETIRNELVTVPNNAVGKEAIINFGSGNTVAIELALGVAYGAPPNRVRANILETLAEMPGVAKAPPPLVFVTAFADSAIQYLVRFWIADAAVASNLRDGLLTRLWYRFKREGIELPFPQRVVTMRTEAPEVTNRGALLAEVDLFGAFDAAERAAIAESALERRFGAGETIIAAGEEGRTFYVVVSGTVAVLAGSPPKEVETIAEGSYFGEMSLLTGELRSATVVAKQDTVLLEIDRPAFARYFAKHPEVAPLLAEVLARRRAALASATDTLPGAPESGPMLTRLKQLFGLGS